MNKLSRREAIVSATAASTLAFLPVAGLAEMPADLVGGWREAVLIVPALAPWIEVLTVIGGWETVWHGHADTSLNRLWSLPSGAQTEQALMRNRKASTGMLRLVVVTGAEQRRIRPDDQAWETSGVQALDIRVTDMDATYRALEARGWNGASDPVRYTVFGKDVSEWATRSPDGIRLAFIQRIAPPLPDVSMLNPWGPATNAAITVKDLAASQHFFADILGMKQTSHGSTVGGNGPNVMGLPWEYQRTLKVEICGFAGPGHDLPLELISMPQAQGRDYAAHARPPNLGTAALRFVVPDIIALAQRFASLGMQPAASEQAVTIEPYGQAKVFALISPDGLWLEFIEYAA